MTNMRCGRVLSCALYGIQGIVVDIEVTILPGLPSFEIVGLGDSAVRESRNRVHAAIKNNGFEFPVSRVTACYAPAWLRKAGSGFDLPLALAILMASGQMAKPDFQVCAFGELSLSGDIRSVPGTICRATSCQEKNLQLVLVPAANAAEVLPVCPDNCIPVKTLREAVGILNDLADGRTDRKTIIEAHQNSRRTDNPVFGSDYGRPIRDIDSIVGQAKAVRALQIAAAGRHNLLFLGSPGCGKTSLASILPDLMPPLDLPESVLVTRIYSASGLLGDGGGLIRQRPFRAPHHTITRNALVGGGAIPAPGEITLAHHGILFLDEMSEFHPETLDLLRQPIEEHKVRLLRLHHHITYPADFILVGAANPCRCGEYLEPTATCRCTPDSVRQHLSRLSGPLLDRIDLTVEMTRLSARELHESSGCNPECRTNTETIAAEILHSWQLQKSRCRQHRVEFVNNGRFPSTQLAQMMEIPDNVAAFAADSASRLNFSVRGYQKMLRVSRTIADLEKSDTVKWEHMAEAFQYRLRLPG